MDELTIEEAREFLKKQGYAVGGMWSIDDVQGKFDCTDEEAMDVIESALENEATMEQVWFAIDFHAEDMGLTEIEDEDED